MPDDQAAASSIDRRALLSGIAASALGGVLLPAAARAQTTAAEGGFSFVGHLVHCTLTLAEIPF